MTRHTYNEDEAPTNTGSIKRKARLDLRLTCSARARTHKVFGTIREMTGLAGKDKCYADVWEEKILPALEHIVWNAKEAPKSTRDFVMSLFAPLPKEDYVRERYKRDRERFEKAVAG